MTKTARMIVLAYEDHAPTTEMQTFDALAAAVNNLSGQAAEQDLAVDWSTFTATPDEEEFDVTVASGGVARKDSFSVLRYTVVAVKVEG